MPVSPEVAESNRLQTERMRRPVQQMHVEQLLIRLPNGWSIAGALAHIAVWDRQRLCLMRRWAAGHEAHGAYDGEVFNEAIQPLLEWTPPEHVVAIAVKTVEEIDAFLLQVSDNVVAAAIARPDKPNLDRGSHRGYHLDQIERALAAAGFG